jgi:MATE family multidrug resistance protein
VLWAATWLLLYHSQPLFALAGLSDGVCRFGYDYLLFRIIGLLPVFWYWTYNAFLEGLGNTRTPMVIALIANGINVVADYALIFGVGAIPAMGVRGAGLATALSNTFMVACFAVVIHRRNGRYRLPLSIGRALPLDWRLLRQMLRLGIPMGVQFFMEVGAYLVFSVVVGWVGDTALAANQVALRVMSISFMVAFGIGVATTTLVGRHQGEAKSDLAMSVGRRSVTLMLAYSAVCGVLFVAVPRLIAGMFTTASEVIDTTVTLLYVAAIFQIFDGVNMVGYGALRGAGDTRWPLWVVITVHWCLGIPLVYYLTIAAGLGVIGTWIGMSLTMVVQAGFIFYRFESGRWKAMRLVETT